jgi:hypothetical protein
LNSSGKYWHSGIAREEKENLINTSLIPWAFSRDTTVFTLEIRTIP